MKKGKREFRAFEIREDSGDQGELRGHAALFDSEAVIGGMFREVIAPGAFAKTIREFDQVALWNHDTAKPLARKSEGTLTLMEDDRGLAFSMKLGETSWQKDAQIAIQQRDVKNMSFGFDVLSDEWAKAGADGELPLRTIKEVRLYEVSPVTFPAYADTTVEARAILEASGITSEATTSGPVPANHLDAGAKEIEQRKADHAARMRALELAEAEMWRLKDEQNDRVTGAA